MIQGATFRFDVGQQRLYLTVPQIYMSNQARGYIAPEYWDNGITAALLNYDFSGNRVRDSYGGTSDYAYLNLKTGLNIGSWRLRDNTSWSYSAGKGTARITGSTLTPAGAGYSSPALPSDDGDSYTRGIFLTV